MPDPEHIVLQLDAPPLPHIRHDDAQAVGGDRQVQAIEPELHEHRGQHRQASDQAREAVDRGEELGGEPLLVQQHAHDADGEGEEADDDTGPEEQARVLTIVGVFGEVLVSRLVAGGVGEG